MNTLQEFLIPENTAIHWRNVDHDLKLKPHVTEKPLRFSEIKCTGDGGLTYYFELGDWLIVVDADCVIRDSERNESEIQAWRPSEKRNIVSEEASSYQESGATQAVLAYVPMLRLNRA